MKKLLLLRPIRNCKPNTAKRVRNIVFALFYKKGRSVTNKTRRLISFG